jgi:hypothetical protein
MLKLSQMIKALSGIVALVLLFVFFFACKKNDIESRMLDRTNSVIFSDLIPDSTITSIREMQTHGPVPSDSSASLLVDLDQDNLMDFRIFVSTIYEWVSASNPEANYTYVAGIGALRSTDSVAVAGYFGPCEIAHPFALDSVIFDNTVYASLAMSYSVGTLTWPCSAYNLQADTYYGVKLISNGGYKFGWILTSYSSFDHTLTIKEFALNGSINRPVKAGQKN